ncbi:MAG: PhzF family phenazine biosynthesis protein [Holosporales bacterium]|jgi:PhzF family phenazine biosynthesis protein|nr:PhzF family phenazine biosynthesis protein [Holosporales bacterium]
MFFLVDAFTETPFKGNPAGVCIIDEYPDDHVLQKMAKYYNWSEIAFLKKMKDNKFQIRWFSPLDEAPLCGHATLAAAHIIFSKQLVFGDTINFEHKNGTLLATKTKEEISMNFPAKPVCKCKKVPFSIKKIIGIDDCIEIMKDDTLYIIVLNSKKAVFDINPNFSEIAKIDCRAIVITAKGDEDFDFYSRYFAPKVGIYEDPVCGSMHCRLACYWSKIIKKNTFKAFQASKRSGILTLELHNQIVKIAGKAVTLCEIYENI